MRNAYNVKYKVLGAFRHLMVPLVRILIRNGVGVHEFSQIVKEAYAQVCLRDFASVTGNGRVSPARISIITGLTRNEVGALLAEDGPLSRAMRGDAERIANLLQGWHTDPEFVGPYGVPRDLFLDVDPLGLQTFTELVRRYGSGGSREEVSDGVE